MQAAYWAFPSLVALVLYWPGVMTWFQKDDFVWLGLRDHVHSWPDLMRALFTPLAQGTMRTLSERAYFLSFSSLFGLHALPFRIWAFLTGFATAAMLSAVCAKLTRSRAAGFWAAIFWVCNSTTAFVFSWTAIYYELLCALFFLVGLWLLIRYAETGDKRFYMAQWITYLIGFLVLELNVVYPALALMYALCCARGIVGKVIPMFVPAAAYTALHLAMAPLLPSGVYRMHWDSSVVPTFWIYWKFALGPNRLIYANIHPSLFRSALAVSLMVGLAGFLGWTVYKRQWHTTFFAAWFVIVLAPLLPLRDHITDCYLTVPNVGLAMWGAWAFVSGWRSSRAARAAAVALLCVYLGVNIPIARISCQSFFDNGRRIHRLISDVVERTASRPEKMIVLKGVTRSLFWDAIWNRPFRLYGRNEVRLIVEDGADIIPFMLHETVADFFISQAAAKNAVDRDQAVLFDVSGQTVRDITAEMR